MGVGTLPSPRDSCRATDQSATHWFRLVREEYASSDISKRAAPKHRQKVDHGLKHALSTASVVHTVHDVGSHVLRFQPIKVVSACLLLCMSFLVCLLLGVLVTSGRDASVAYLLRIPGSPWCTYQQPFSTTQHKLAPLPFRSASDSLSVWLATTSRCLGPQVLGSGSQCV